MTATPLQFLTRLLGALLVAIILATFARTWVVQVFRIPTGSMRPGLEAGDHVIVNRFIFGPTHWPQERDWLPVRSLRRGDVAVFKHPRQPRRNFVKRCVGIAGDRLEIVEKKLLLNDEEQDESGYAIFRDPRVYSRSLMLDDAYRKRDNFGPLIVPQGQAFFLGDDRDNSNDSRFWGLVPVRYVIGRPILVPWTKGKRASAEGESGRRPGPRWIR